MPCLSKETFRKYLTTFLGSRIRGPTEPGSKRNAFIWHANVLSLYHPRIAQSAWSESAEYKGDDVSVYGLHLTISTNLM